jgi:dTDP-4-dehydrorhamnose reductase
LYSAFGKNFVKTIINRIDENKALKITTEEEGTPTSCIDLSKFIFYVIDEEKMPYGIYNFSAQGSTSWYGFACEIANQYNSEIKGLISPTDHFKTQAQRPKYSVLNLSKTEKVYTKLDKWEISLKRVVEILKNEIKSKTKES